MTAVQIRMAPTAILKGIVAGITRASPEVRAMAQNELYRRG